MRKVRKREVRAKLKLQRKKLYLETSLKMQTNNNCFKKI